MALRREWSWKTIEDGPRAGMALMRSVLPSTLPLFDPPVPSLYTRLSLPWQFAKAVRPGLLS